MAKKTVKPTVLTDQAKAEAVKVHFCIPHLRTVIILAEAWEFGLYRERRNFSVVRALKMDGSENNEWTWAYQNGVYGQEISKLTLPAGTRLAIDRIYIRNGAADFDSVTFRVKECPDERFNKCRFWAKLRDVNRIISYPVGTKDVAVDSAFASFAAAGLRLLEI